MASTMSKNKKTHKAAAVKALADAEAYFKIQKLNSAIKEATQAKNLDPNLPNVDNFITAYKIHKAMSLKKNWYVVLDIPECSHFSVIKKSFKALALMVHPDKNLSAAAEDAFKHIKDALDFLSDPVRKEDYDKSFMSKNKAFAAAAAKMPETTAAAKKAAAAAAAAMARKAAMEAFAAKVAAERKAATKAAAKIRKAAADAAALEAELAAAKRKLAAETAAVSRKAAEAAAASRKAAEAAAVSRKAAEAAVPAAAARSAINARKRREPMSELEYGIHLIMKYSPNYMERRFSVR